MSAVSSCRLRKVTGILLFSTMACLLMPGCSGWKAWRRGAPDRDVASFSVSGMRLSKKVKPLTQIKRENVIFQRGDFSCGSAAMATIMRYYFGDDVDEQVVVDGVIELSNTTRLQKIIRRKGFSLLDLKRFAVSRGYEAKGYLMGLDDLMRLKTPAIVPMVVKGYDHFVVIRGSARGRLFIADPSAGNITIRAKSFLDVWKGGVVFVISNGKEPEGAPIMIDREDMLFLDSHFVLRSIRNAILSY